MQLSISSVNWRALINSLKTPSNRTKQILCFFTQYLNQGLSRIIGIQETKLGSYITNGEPIFWYRRILHESTWFNPTPQSFMASKLVDQLWHWKKLMKASSKWVKKSVGNWTLICLSRKWRRNTLNANHAKLGKYNLFLLLSDFGIFSKETLSLSSFFSRCLVQNSFFINIFYPSRYLPAQS